MRLWAISDLHLNRPENLRAFESFPSHPEDWLILAGDLANGSELLNACFESLVGKYARVLWVPGNHELWSSRRGDDAPRGQALYERLVSLAQGHGVVTPEDPYPLFPDPAAGPVAVAPLFLLYDYSFRPDDVARERVVPWAREAGSLCADEAFLRPDPFPDREAWCAKRCAASEARLNALPADLPTVLVNHFPLEERLAVLPRAPRFTPWCGTRRTRGWHRRFNACAAVYGHLHIRKTDWIDGVPFQEVSLGYPAQWDRTRGIGAYLREVILAPTQGGNAGREGSGYPVRA